jgi:uncharacterized protein (TIGR02598 family)
MRFPHHPYFSRLAWIFREGFSLVEVLMATALVTFALLVISLLPAGLAALQDASRQTGETEICNTVGAEMAPTPFEELNAYSPSRFPIYFENEGLVVKNASEAIYSERCGMVDPELGEGELRRAIVAIAHRRDSSDPGVKARRRTFLLVNRGI